MMKKVLVALVVLVLIAVAVWFFVGSDPTAVPAGSSSADATTNPARPSTQIPDVDPAPSAGADASAEGASEAEVAPEEDPEERLVNAFDDLTDVWMNADDKRKVTEKDVTKFVTQFKGLPRERREECLQRALNLIPDEHVMLLVGILLDPSVDKELVDLVFNDILNRDETIKEPILRLVAKDKDHPNCADARWVLDVTGQEDKP